MSVAKEFLIKKSLLTKALIIGLLPITIAIIDLVTIGSTTVPTWGGILLVLAYVLCRNHSIVKLFDDHIEIKLLPTSSKHMILYSEIELLEKRSKNIFLAVNQAGKKKKVSIPMMFLTDDDTEELIKELERKIS
jgi:hypothetical protein